MPDTIDPNKSITDPVEEADKKLKLLMTESQDGINQLSATLIGGVKTAFDTLASVGRESFAKFKEANTIINENNILFDKFSKSYITFREITKTKDLFSGLTNSTATFGMVTDHISAMGTEWGHLTDLVTNSGGMGIGKAAGLMLSNLKDNAGYGQKAEAQMVSMLSAGGNLNDMFDQEGNLIADLNTQTLKYVNTLGDVAEANGISLASTIKFADAFNRIPGIMAENVNMGAKLGGEMSALNAAMKVMTGSGQGEAEFMRIRDIAYENLGNSMDAVSDKGRKHIALFATMSSLSKDLGLTFSETSGFLGDIAKQFKFVGDNTEAAAKVMGRFTDALRNTGLTSSASLDIIKGMVKSVGELSIGTKAFVSARSGGPGGLQGSVQIDKLNREGKSDQVMSMVLDTLKQQFGGRIVTQAEGATNQESAAQFTKQKMMIQSGAFGNLVGSGPGADEKATRLLEALASGNTGKAVKVSQEAIEAVGKQGNTIQKENNTILQKVALSSERTAMATQLTALKDFKQYLGSGNEKIRNNLSQNMDEAGANTRSKENRNLTLETSSEDWNNQFRNIAQKGAKDLLSGLGLAYSGATKLASDAKQSIQDGGKAMAILNNQLAETEKNKRIQKITPTLGRPSIAQPISDDIKRQQFTKDADQRKMQAAVTNATRARAIETPGVDHKFTIVVSPEAKKMGIDVIESPGTRKDESGNIIGNLNNSPNRDPGY